jgi:hypothetical protein
LTSRPKKKKPEWLGDPVAEESERIEKTAGVDEEGSTATSNIHMEVLLQESPGAVRRREAAQTFDYAMLAWEAASEVADEARAKKLMVRRLVDAKEKRLEASYARTRKQPLKNPWNRVRRSYENVIDDLEASLKCQAAATGEAECEARAAICHVNVLQLEIARLKRELRRCRNARK